MSSPWPKPVFRFSAKRLRAATVAAAIEYDISIACQTTTMAAVREMSAVELRLFVELLRRMVNMRVLFKSH